MNRSNKLESKNIQDILALTPLQEGLLFHYLQDPRQDSYFNQLDLEVSGDINPRYFEQAWNFVIETNEMLRTVFRWEKLEKPTQVVLERHTLYWKFEDLASVGDSVEQKKQWDTGKQQDRNSRFDLRQVPFRVILGKMAQNRFQMLISNHHILYDGWSTGIILKEFFQAYETLAEGNQPLVPREKTGFKEFIRWHREQDRWEQKKYWQHYLEGFDTPTRLPGKRANPERGLPGKSDYRLHLSQAVKDKLDVFVKEKRITRAAVFYCAWGLLLQKYCGSEEVVFGSTVSGRSAPIQGIEDMVGMFINTIPLRAGSEPGDTLLDFLVRINNHLAEGEKYENTPLVDIYSCCRQFSPGGEELFDTLVAVENYPLDIYLRGSLRGPGSHLSILSYSLAEMPHYDLTLAISAAEGIDFDFIYKNTSFAKETIVRLAHHFNTILKGIVENVEYRPRDIEILSGEEKHQLLVDFNRTAADYPTGKTIYGLFAEQVRRTPDRIALVGSSGIKDRTDMTHITYVSYRELNEKSNRLAYILLEKGIQIDTIVGIMLERSLEMIIGILGILKSSGAYLPIDIDYPGERIDYMLKDSSAKILLTANEMASFSTECAVTPEAFPNLSEGRRFTNDQCPMTNNQLAYIIYTSGSTGRPKGVLVEHRSVIRLVKNTGYIEFKDRDRILQTGALSFDASTFEIWGVLLNGLGLVLLPKERILNPGTLKWDLQVFEISTIWMTAPLFNQISDVDEEIFKGLGNLLVGGDVLSTVHIERIRKKFPGLNIINGYGPTENTTFSTTYLIDKEYKERIPIGKPITNSTAYIVDKNGNLQPIGIVGEIWVGGDGVGRGYLNDPGLTREKFIFHRSYRFYMTYIPKKLYKTGDLGRWLPDGNIEFIGRADTQVKIRGFRVEMGEIENRLLKVRGVKEAVVLVREDVREDKYICAYFVSDSENEIPGLREYLSMELPDYMIPSYFVPLEKIPLTPNGKIDRGALPKPGLKVGDSYTAPGNEIERKLLEIWSGVLGIEKEKISINDNFFHLGGHSLKATLLVSRIHKELNVNVPLSEIFKTSHIRGLAAFIKNAETQRFFSIAAVEKREYYILSSVQGRLMVLQQMDQTGIAYNMPSVWQLEGNLDGEKFAAVFQRLIRRHESLRTSFHMVNDEPVQRIAEEVEVKVKVEEEVEEEEERSSRLEGTRGLAPLSLESATRRPPAAAALISSFIRPFDLSKAPLLRVGLLKQAEQKIILTVDMHHIISDEMSIGIFVREFMELYAGKKPPVLRLQYKDYSAWQNRPAFEKSIQQQEAYWLKEFAGEVPVLDLPLDYPRPAVQDFAGSSIHFRIGAEETAALKSLAHEQAVTMFMLVLALYIVCLSRLSGQADIVVGTPAAGRRHADLQPLVGMFVNTLVLRHFPPGSRSFTQFLQEVKERSLKAFENQDYLYEDLVEKVDPERDTGRNPLFDTMFAFQDFAALKIQIPGLKVQPLDYETRIAKFDLALTAVEARENLLFIFDYCTKLFKQETIRRFTGYFTKTVSAVIACHDIKISGIEIIGAEEKNRLLYEFNDTAADYPGDKTIHRLFEEQVERTPDHIALVGSSGVKYRTYMTHMTYISYRQLNEKSNHLAGMLLEKGVLPDTIAGLMPERSVAMIIGILGILKSGGAYLPIDPDYPQERIDYMLKDSSAKILLTGNELSFLSVSPVSPVAKNSLPGTSLAYVLYTSGSTGKPKGVMVEHRNVIRLVKNSNYIHFSPRDRLLLTGSLAFDIGTFEIWGPLCNGITLFLASKQVVLNTEKLKEVLQENEISILHLIPQLFNQLAARDIGLFAGLRCFLVGGDLVQPFYINKLRQRYNRLEILHMYGPTENTTFSTFFPVDKEYTTNIPIGKPIGNTIVYIMATHGHLQPLGVVGELYVGGDGLARGYLNNPGLTGEKFDRDNNQKLLPGVQGGGFLEKSPPGRRRPRIYKTGDLARWQEDGNIEFLGRIDYQVKIRGFRIELGEIETRLLKHIHIKDAVVIARIDEKGDKYLAAYIVTGKPIETAGLRNFLSKSLPDYMIPSCFIPLEAIPLTLTGKIDKKALPGSVFELREKYAAPRTEIERKLAGVWEKVLGREKIGIDENFFMIGGDSIKVMQIASRMRREGYKLEIKDIFHHPTIARLSPWITPVKRELDQGAVTGRIPLTPVQREFFQGGKTAPHHFNQAVMLKIKAGVDKKTLETLFKKIQEHHDALRMSFQIEGKEIVQTGNDVDYPIGIEEHDLRGKAGLKASMASICNEIQAGIDLREGPLMKIGLFHRDDGDRLLIVIHHLAVDGVSWRILGEDIDTLYRQYQQQDKLALPLKTGSFKEWSEKLQEYANREAFLLEKSYWRALESQEVEEIERDIKEGEGNDVRDAGIVSSNISEEETGLLLGKVNEAFGTEINDILLTALGLGLNKTFRKRKYAIALEGHGREDLFKDVDIARTVGWFTSVYPVVLDISYADDPGRQIKEIKENLRKIPHKGTGYGILKYLTAAAHKQDLQFKLKPMICFNYLGQFGTDFRDLSFEITNEPVGHTQGLAGQRDYEFDITGIVIDKQLRLDITYNRGHWHRKTIATLMENLKSGLCRLIAYCRRRERREFTPGDFTYKELPQDVVARLCHQYAVADIYPLSPMQEGMLFHSLVDEHSASYFEQISYRLHSELDIQVFKKSLHQLLRRHDILRTVFIYKGADRPVQVVLKEREADFYYENIGQIGDEAAKAAFIKEFKTGDRKKTFDLSREPAMRVSLLELGNNEYEVIWSSHHILMDGWCIGILNKEFFEIYSGIKENRGIELPAIRPYRDYICWLEQRDRRAAREYWNEYLAGYEERSAVPRLLSGEIKDKGGSHEEVVEFVLETGEMQGLKKIGEKRGVTLNIIMQAIWGILLGRYTGKEDVVFGSVVSGRPPELEGIETMIGLFINTVPVRVSCRGDMEFGALLEKLQKCALESEPYHYCPLAEIQAGSLLKQDLIDHIYVFENYPVVEQIQGYETQRTGATHANETSGLRLSHVEAFEQTNYDFNLVLTGRDRLVTGLAYNRNIFAGEFVCRIGGHFRQILSQVIENDDKKINRVDIITAEEKEQVLYRFNDTRKDFPQEKTLHGLFAEQTERTPDHVALCGQGAFLENRPLDPQKTFYCLTYHELNVQSNRLAGCLIEKGVQPDTIAGLMMERSVAVIIGILGILKSGGAYLPIDPAYPPERIDYMLKDSSAKILLTANEITSLSLENVFKPEAFLNPSEGRYFTNDQCPMTNDPLAYVIYTSGTSGKPKGVLVEHHNAVNVVNWNVAMHKMKSGDFIILVSDYTFDASVGQIFGALSSGAILYIVEKEIRLDTEKLRHYIITHTINLIDLVPTHLKELLCYNDKLKSLHTIISGGEKLDGATKEIIIGKGYRLVNQYGPTETTVDALALECSSKRVSMGKPIANVKVYILDRYGMVLPVEVAGELYIAGAGVTRGYLNRPGLTAEKFIMPSATRGSFEKPPLDPTKLLFIHHSPIYKTGDLTRWLPDGDIEFLGRIDQQVKIRGFRIELGEIENQLLTHRKVKEAIVIARDDHNRDKYLCAYIVAKPGETNPIDSASLREYLAQQLPAYMVPAYFVQLHNIPLTSSGKVDRKALPEPKLKAGKNYTAPQNETEKKLTEIWSDILDVEKEKISVHDNFFHLGGHSLKATLLVSRIHKELKVNIPLSEIFKTSHIRGLAAFVNRTVKDKYKKIAAVETKEYYPVFSAQERVYLSHRIDKSKVGYNLIHAVPLEKNPGIDKLESSLKKLLHRHESLRTSFELVNGQIVQRVHQDLSFEIEYIRLNKSMDNPGVSTPRAEELAADFMRPFDLSAPPLFRIGLVETAKGEHILIIGIHHIITDGRSLEILTQEFISLYTQTELVPLRLQFKDFSNWYNSPRQKTSIKEQEAFWTSRFKDKITLLNLPTDFARPTVLTSAGDIVGFNLDSQKTRELGKIQIETETTMFMVLIAIYSVFLAKITHQEDILVGIPIAGRRHPDLHQITGMFVNTLVIRSRPTQDKSFREFLSQMKEYALQAFENQEFQFENLVKLMTVKRHAGRNPIFDTMFSYQEIDKNKTGDIEAVTGQYDYKHKTSLFDLSLVVIDQKDTLKCTFFYNKNLFKKSTVTRWGRYFRDTIDAIVNRPGIKLGKIDILSEEDKQRILEKSDKTGEKDRQEKGPGNEECSVEPATEKEQKILAIWEKILDRETPGVTADFFQVGGSSIGALLLVTDINKTFKRKLSITDIYENESIRKQAALVEQTPEPGKGENSAKDKKIIRLKVGTRGGKNIFLIHDATGEVDKYRLFCKELKSRDSYWGLPLRGAAAGRLAPQALEIENLASGYLAAIKPVQARGPYYLGGWSIGGLIAFEMARQLEQAGEQVEQLYMFDTAVPAKNTPAQSFDLPGERALINRHFQVPVTVFAGFKATNPEDFWQEFLNFVENDETYNQAYIVDKLAEYSELIGDFHRLPAVELCKYVNRFRSTARAGTNYFPGTRIKAKLQYYQAESSGVESSGVESSGLDPANWQDFFIDKIDLQQTRGNHFNMFNGPNLRYLLGIFQEHN